MGSSKTDILFAGAQIKKWAGFRTRGPAPMCVMRYLSNVRVLCKEQPLLATALPVLDGQKNWGKSILKGLL